MTTEQECAAEIHSGKTVAFLQRSTETRHPDFAAHLAGELGGKLIVYDDGTAQITAPGPRHSARDESLSVKLLRPEDDAFEREFVANPFTPNNTWQEYRDHVKEAADRALQNIAAGLAPRVIAGRGASSGERVEAALAKWFGLPSARGTLAETYLASRGLALPDNADQFVRFDQWAKRREIPNDRTSRMLYDPAMVTALGDCHTCEFRALQNTFLRQDGSKIERRFEFGTSPKGAAIKLEQLNGARRLHVGEGFETCLTAQQEFRLAPTWALGTANALPNFDVVEGVEELWIIGENDRASAIAAAQCADRWRRAGKTARIIKPSDLRFKDFNDMLTGKVRQ